MRKILTMTAILGLLSGCAIVTVPVKVATTAVGTAVDIVD